MSWQVAFSAGCFGGYPTFDDPGTLVSLLRQVRCGLVEMPAYGSWPGRPPEDVAALRSSGKRFFAVHADKRAGRFLQTGDPEGMARGLALMEEAAGLGIALGAALLDAHLWGAGADLGAALAALPAASEVAEKAGLLLCVEFVPGAGEPLAVLREVAARGAAITLDTEFLAWFGPAHELLRAALGEFGGRVRNIHVRDFDGRPYDDAGRRRYCRFGEGCLEVARTLAVLSEARWEGYLTVELGPTTPEEVNRALEVLAP